MQCSLIKRFKIGSVAADIGSDWHLCHSQKEAGKRAAEKVLREKQSEILICAGDLFGTRDGADSSNAINEFFHTISAHYRYIMFIAGNHDLRGRDNPWRSFDLPSNVICPNDDQPIVLTINGTSFLLANIFYDMEFFDPTHIGLDSEAIKRLYRRLVDGRHLFGGDISRFVHFRRQAADALTAKIDALVTHCLPHPALANFRFKELTEEQRAYGKTHGLEFICNPEEDARLIHLFNSENVETLRRRWNTKSAFMGSNVLEDPRANFRDGITLIHGHHHRRDLRTRRILDKTVHVVTHQTP